MAMMNKVFVWPDYLRPVNDFTMTPKSGITRAKYRTGAEIRRTFYDKPLLDINAKFIISPIEDDFERQMMWFSFLESGVKSFLFKNPHPESYPTVFCGVSSGGDTTFVAPVVNFTGSHRVNVNGKPYYQRSVYTDGPNMLSFGQSLGDPSLGNFVPDADVTVSASIYSSALLNAYSFKQARIAKNATASDAALRLPIPDVSVSSGEIFTAMTDVIGNTGVDFAAGVIVGGGDIVGTYLNPNLNEWTVGSVTATVPADDVVQGLAHYMDPDAQLTHYIGAATLARGDLSVWYPGDVRMPVIVMNAPLPEGDLVTYVPDSGNEMLMCSVDEISYDIKPDGMRIVSVKMHEVAP